MPSPAERYSAARARQAGPSAGSDGSVRAPLGTELERFRAGYPFGLDPFQVQACAALEAGRGVLVAAPTGAGKTVVGEFAVHLALAEGRKCFYTTPIKALSNQKYGDLVARHGADRVGLLTGDNSVNGDADVVVMTTEVLRNMLYARSSALVGLAYVVMDEVHYLSDRFRGAVWEEVIIHLPESVRLVSLSATVSNAEEFGDWLVTVRGETEVVVGGAPAGAAVAARDGRPAPARPVGGRHRPAGAGGQPRAAPARPRRGAATDGSATAARPAAGAGRSAARARRTVPTSWSGSTGPACCRRSSSCSAAPAATRPSSSACGQACA